MPLILGVDPGSIAAAAVLLDGRTVLAWACYWRVSKRIEDGFHLASHARRGRASILPTACLAVAGEVDCDGYAVCRERLFAGRSPASALVLAEASGLLCGALAPRATAWLPRPLAVEWRPAVLGVSGGTADVLEAIAVEWARKHLEWPTGYPDLPSEPLGAVAEAACIAVYAGNRPPCVPPTPATRARATSA